jgi:hypothetical protein
MECTVVVGPNKLVQVDIEDRVVTAQFPTIEIWHPFEILDYPGWGITAHVIYHAAPNGFEQQSRNLHWPSCSGKKQGRNPGTAMPLHIAIRISATLPGPERRIEEQAHDTRHVSVRIRDRQITASHHPRRTPPFCDLLAASLTAIPSFPTLCCKPVSEAPHLLKYALLKSEKGSPVGTRDWP